MLLWFVRNGEDVELALLSFDSQLKYDCVGRKPCGRFAIADVAFDS